MAAIPPSPPIESSSKRPLSPTAASPSKKHHGNKVEALTFEEDAKDDRAKTIAGQILSSNFTLRSSESLPPHRITEMPSLDGTGSGLTASFSGGVITSPCIATSPHSNPTSDERGGILPTSPRRVPAPQLIQFLKGTQTINGYSLQEFIMARSEEEPDFTRVKRNLTNILNLLPAKEKYKSGKGPASEPLQLDERDRRNFRELIELLYNEYHLAGSKIIVPGGKCFAFLFKEPQDIQNIAHILNSCAYFGEIKLGEKIFKALLQVKGIPLETLRMWEKAAELWTDPMEGAHSFLKGDRILNHTNMKWKLDQICSNPAMITEEMRDEILKLLPASTLGYPIDEEGCAIDQDSKRTAGQAPEVQANFKRLLQPLMASFGFEQQPNGDIRLKASFTPASINNSAYICRFVRLANIATILRAKSELLAFFDVLKGKDLNERNILHIENAIYEGSLDAWRDENAILQFLQGEGRDDLGRTLPELQGRSDRYLEDSHCVIQRLFLLNSFSKSELLAPLSTPIIVEAFNAQDERGEKLRSELLKSYLRMLSFYGFKREDNKDVVQSDQFFEKSQWLSPENHNFRRISRILSCLKSLGLADEAFSFFAALCNLSESCPDSITGETLEFWSDALES